MKASKETILEKYSNPLININSRVPLTTEFNLFSTGPFSPGLIRMRRGSRSKWNLPSRCVAFIILKEAKKRALLTWRMNEIWGFFARSFALHSTSTSGELSCKLYLSHLLILVDIFLSLSNFRRRRRRNHIQMTHESNIVCCAERRKIYSQSYLEQEICRSLN